MKRYFVDFNENVIVIGVGCVTGLWFDDKDKAITCYNSLCKAARMGQAHYPTFSESSGLLIEAHNRPLLTDIYHVDF